MARRLLSTLAIGATYNQAEVLVAKQWPSAFGDLERAVDELFNDLLINPWRQLTAPPGQQSTVIELGDRYEVRLPTGEVDPQQIHVEVTEHRLVIRAPGAEDSVREQSFSFAVAVDREGTTARWADRKLAVVLPKRKQRPKS